MDTLKFKHAKQIKRVINVREFERENIKTMKILLEIDKILKLKKLMAD